MPKKLIIVSLVIALVVAVAAIFIKKNNSNEQSPTPTPAPSLPVNAIPVGERPFITLSPDSSGRNLFLTVDGAPESGLMEYELVYQAGDKQEGVFGRLDLEDELQPIEKKLLLGSQSAGGKITYHEGVTGGSLTVTYGETKLKEQFNFLRFDPDDSTVTSSDVRFSLDFAKNAFTSNAVVIIMKPFGLPTPPDSELIAGPYAYFSATAPKGDVAVSLTLPAGEHQNPTIFEYDLDAGGWVALDTTLEGDTVSAKVGAGNTFIVSPNNT